MASHWNGLENSLNPATESVLAQGLRRDPVLEGACVRNPKRPSANSAPSRNSEKLRLGPVTTCVWNPKEPSTRRQQTASEFSGRFINKPQERVWTPKNPSTNCRLDSEHPGAPVYVSCSRLSSEELISERSTHVGTLKLVHEPLSQGFPSRTTSPRWGKRPTPSLPHPAVLRLQAFSTS